MTVKFIVAGIQRTGTTLLTSSLDLHPEINCLGEVFLFKKKRGRNIEGSFRRYFNRQGSISRYVSFYLSKTKMLKNYLNELFSSYDEKAVGFKLMHDQYCQFFQLKRYIQENDIKTIHLIRKNNLKVLASRHALKKTGQAHSKTKVEVGRVHIPIRSLKYRLKRLQLESLWATKFEYNDNYIRIYYEDLLANYDNEMIKVFLFLGVDPNLDIIPPLKKIAPDNLHLLIENYKAVEQELMGTEFETYLDSSYDL